MSTQKVLVNDTVRIRVRFVDINPSTGEEVDIEPVTVLVEITNTAGSVVVSEDAEPQTPSVFYFDFVPSVADTYNVKFTGILDDGNSVVIQQKLYVSSLEEDYRPTVTLKADETIIFAPDVDPLYMDPEQLLAYFPDATLLEIGELMHSYSQEVKKIYNIHDDDDGSNLPFIVYEYIKAAAACDLTRTYGFGGDDDMSISLGDLSINSRSLPRNIVNRDNATTWCQIATALRKEMLAGKVGPTSMQPKGLPGKKDRTSGKIFESDTGKVVYLSDRDLLGPGRKLSSSDDPMPERDLRSYD
jgi:hypothetical protein